MLERVGLNSFLKNSYEQIIPTPLFPEIINRINTIALFILILQKHPHISKTKKYTLITLGSMIIIYDLFKLPYRTVLCTISLACQIFTFLKCVRRRIEKYIFIAKLKNDIYERKWSDIFEKLLSADVKIPGEAIRCFFENMEDENIAKHVYTLYGAELFSFLTYGFIPKNLTEQKEKLKEEFFQFIKQNDVCQKILQNQESLLRAEYAVYFMNLISIEEIFTDTYVKNREGLLDALLTSRLIPSLKKNVKEKMCIFFQKLIVDNNWEFALEKMLEHKSKIENGTKHLLLETLSNDEITFLKVYEEHEEILLNFLLTLDDENDENNLANLKIILENFFVQKMKNNDLKFAIECLANNDHLERLQEAKALFFKKIKMDGGFSTIYQRDNYRMFIDIIKNISMHSHLFRQAKLYLGMTLEEALENANWGVLTTLFTEKKLFPFLKSPQKIPQKILNLDVKAKDWTEICKNASYNSTLGSIPFLKLFKTLTIQEESKESISGSHIIEILKSCMKNPNARNAFLHLILSDDILLEKFKLTDIGRAFFEGKDDFSEKFTKLNDSINL